MACFQNRMSGGFRRYRRTGFWPLRIHSVRSFADSTGTAPIRKKGAPITSAVQPRRTSAVSRGCRHGLSASACIVKLYNAVHPDSIVDPHAMRIIILVRCFMFLSSVGVLLILPLGSAEPETGR